jgi:hypothetical protein
MQQWFWDGVAGTRGKISNSHLMSNDRYLAKLSLAETWKRENA